MSDKCFFDTNVLIYLYSSDEPRKREIIENCLTEANCPTITTQVINEFTNVMRKKRNLDLLLLEKIVKELARNFSIALITIETVERAFKIANKYNYSY